MRIRVFLVLVVVAINVQVIPLLCPVFLLILSVSGCSGDIPCDMSLGRRVGRERAERDIITGCVRGSFLVELPWQQEEAKAIEHRQEDYPSNPRSVNTFRCFTSSCR